MVVYLDSSALVKLVVRERESRALRRRIRGMTQVASALAVTEVPRAIARALPPVQHQRARTAPLRMLAQVSLIPVDLGILEAAANLHPATLRSLDAIHVASALRLLPAVPLVVTYDSSD